MACNSSFNGKRVQEVVLSDWCLLFFQNGWYQIRWHHMTRIHKNLKIEFVKILWTLVHCLYTCLQGTLSIVFGQGWRGSLRAPKLGFFRVDVCGCNGHVPRGTRETPALRSRMRPFSMPSLKRGGSMWKLHASVVIWNSWYCWWFRNPKQPPGMYEALVNNGIKLLQSIDYGFLNHQQCDFRRFRFKPHHTLRSFEMQGGVLKIGVGNYIPWKAPLWQLYMKDLNQSASENDAPQ